MRGSRFRGKNPPLTPFAFESEWGDLKFAACCLIGLLAVLATAVSFH